MARGGSGWLGEARDGSGCGSGPSGWLGMVRGHTPHVTLTGIFYRAQGWGERSPGYRVRMRVEPPRRRTS
eukprot:221149-Prymnesium_polylepis.1